MTQRPQYGKDMHVIFASDAAKWLADRDHFPCTAMMPVRMAEQGP